MAELVYDEFGFIPTKDVFSDLTYDVTCFGAERMTMDYHVFPSESKRDLTFDEAFEFAKDYLKKFNNSLHLVVITGWRKHDDGHVTKETYMELRTDQLNRNAGRPNPPKNVDPFGKHRFGTSPFSYGMPEGTWTGGTYMPEY